MIDNPNTPSATESVADMKRPARSLVFTDTDGILLPELFNLTTKSWKQLAPEAVSRNHHAISILLPDATLFSGGGGLCYVNTIGGSTAGCDKSVDHADGQIFEPPYLFTTTGALAARPMISGLSSTTIKVGATITLTVTGGGTAKLVLIRMGSVTHSINSDQRRVPIAEVSNSGNLYTATLPADSGVLIPGFYYLFALSSTGVPSVGSTVRVTLEPQSSPQNKY